MAAQTHSGCPNLEALLLTLIAVLNPPDCEADGRGKASFNLKLKSRSAFLAAFPLWEGQKACAGTQPPSREVSAGLVSPANLL